MNKNKKVIIETKAEKKPNFVKLDKLYKDIDWKKFKNKPVIPVGADTMTNNLVGNLENNANFLVVGKKGSGKTTFIHSAIVNILRNSKPDKLKMILIDLDKSDLSLYKQITNLIFPVITKREKIGSAVNWCLYEFSRRLDMINEKKFKKIEQHFDYVDKEMPKILVVISGCSELIKESKKRYRWALNGLANYGRMANFCFLITSSSISKELYPQKFLDIFYKVALASNSAKESKMFIGEEGAEKIKRKGEGLYKNPINAGKARPVQCFYINKKEIKKAVASYVSQKSNPRIKK